MANGKWLQCRRSRTHTHMHTHNKGGGLQQDVAVGVGTVAAEQSCVKSSALMSGQIKCYTRRRIAATRLVVATRCTALRDADSRLLTPIPDSRLPPADCRLPASDSPLDICLKLRFMSCHERNWKFPCFFFFLAQQQQQAATYTNKHTHTYTLCIPCSLDCVAWG